MRHSIVYSLQRCQRGLTLVELIVSMVIISIALGGVLMVMNFTVSHSADPMIQHQAVAIAESYMEEVVLQHYDNPIGGYTGTTRNLFDDVTDYNGLIDSGAKDHNGDAITGLENYTVSIVVAVPADFGPAGNVVQAREISVWVQRGTEVDLTLTGYRADYD